MSLFAEIPLQLLNANWGMPHVDNLTQFSVRFHKIFAILQIF